MPIPVIRLASTIGSHTPKPNTQRKLLDQHDPCRGLCRDRRCDGNRSSGWDALVVLAVNSLCVTAAGVLTGLLLRRRLEHRARAFQDAALSSPASED